MNKYELQGKIMYLMHQYIEQNFDDENDWMYWLMMGTPDGCNEAYCAELAICPNVRDAFMILITGISHVQ